MGQVIGGEKLSESTPAEIESGRIAAGLRTLADTSTEPSRKGMWIPYSRVHNRYR